MFIRFSLSIYYLSSMFLRTALMLQSHSYAFFLTVLSGVTSTKVCLWLNLSHFWCYFTNSCGVCFFEIEKLHTADLLSRRKTFVY